MNNEIMYLVTSLRDYGQCEVYYGPDGWFRTYEEARAYIMADMKETVNDWDGDYEDLELTSAYKEFVIDKDERFFSWRVDVFGHGESQTEDDRTYIVTEWCSNCESEIEMRWNTDDRGYQAFCPVCGAPLMLCDECRHSDDFKDCDWSDGTCHRMKKEDRQNGDD